MQWSRRTRNRLPLLWSWLCVLFALQLETQVASTTTARASVQRLFDLNKELDNTVRALRSSVSNVEQKYERLTGLRIEQQRQSQQLSEVATRAYERVRRRRLSTAPGGGDCPGTAQPALLTVDGVCDCDDGVFIGETDVLSELDHILSQHCFIAGGGDDDSDMVCASEDSCDADGENDADSDMLCADVDSCAADAENDADSDSVCASEDLCPYDQENDIDSDAICGDVDECPYRAGAPGSVFNVSTTSEITAAAAGLCDGDVIQMQGDISLRHQLSFVGLQGVELRSDNASVQRVLSGSSSTRVLFVEAAEVTVSNVKVTGGYLSESSGAGLYVGGGSNVTARHCAFSNNNAAAGVDGVGVSVVDSTFYAQDCEFSTNKGSTNAGGAFFADNSVLTFEDTTWTGNVVTKSGRLASKYEGAISDGAGAGLYARDSQISMDTSIFTYNSVSYYVNGVAVCIVRCTFFASDTSWKNNYGRYNVGTGMYAYLSTVQLVRTTWASNAATNANNYVNTYGRGTALFALSSTLSISDSIFDSNTCSGRDGVGCDGAAIYGSSCSVTVEDSVFRNHHINYRGGAVFVSAGSLTVRSSVFEGNSVWTTWGGALYAESAVVQLTGNNFTGNSRKTFFTPGDDVYLSGGSISVNSLCEAGFFNRGSGSLLSCQGCDAAGEPAELNSMSCTSCAGLGNTSGSTTCPGEPSPSPAPMACQFSGVHNVTTYSELVDALDNLCDGDTVVLFADIAVTSQLSIMGRHDVALRSSNLTERRTITGSGNRVRVLYVSDSSVSIEAVTITGGYHSSGEGGGMLIEASSVVNLTNVAVSSNSGDYFVDGTGIYISGSTLFATDTLFSGNTASYASGGAIYATGSALHFETVTFSANRATNRNNQVNAFGLGAAVHASGCSVFVNNSVFQANTCSARDGVGCDGGAMYLSSSVTSISDSVCSDHHINYRGGCLFVSGGALDVTRTRFEDNSVDTVWGGAVYVQSGASVTFTDCEWIDNSRDVTTSAGDDIYGTSTVEFACNTSASVPDCFGCTVVKLPAPPGGCAGNATL